MWINIKQKPPKFGWYDTASQYSIESGQPLFKKRFWDGDEWLIESHSKKMLPSAINNSFRWYWRF